MQQASSPAEQPLGGGDKLARNEVALQTGPPGRLQHPFRVCTFNVLVSVQHGSMCASRWSLALLTPLPRTRSLQQADGLAQSGDFVKVSALNSSLTGVEAAAAAAQQQHSSSTAAAAEPSV
jgi:hypothetical protein